MIVKYQKDIRFDNSAKAIFNERMLADAIIWYSHTFYERKPVAQTKRVFMYGRYPAVSIHGKKLHIHRLLFSAFIRGLHPKEYVHHKDENRLNATLDNLQLMGASEHQSITNKGRKQSKEHVAKRTASMRKTRYEKPELLAQETKRE